MPNQEIVRSTRGSKQRRLKFSAGLRRKITICLSAIIACFSFVAVGVLASINKVEINLDNRIEYSAASLDSKDGVFLIRNYQDLQFVSNVVNNGKQIPDSNGETYSNAEYLVVNDIECPEGVNFVPIGTSDHPFSGVFNGNGKRIKGLTVNGDNASSVGLFGFVSNCTITGVGLEPGKTEEGTEYGGITNTLSQNATLKSTGGLVGTVTGETTISNCYNWLSVTANTTATSDVFAVGGIVGVVTTAGKLTVTNCYNTGKISGGNVCSGIVGYVQSTESASGTCNISKCYNLGKLDATTINSKMFNTPIAYTSGSGVTISNSYYSTTCGADSGVIGTALELENMSGSDALTSDTKMKNLGSGYVARANTDTKFFFPQLAVFNPRQATAEELYEDDWYWAYKYFDLNFIINCNIANAPDGIYVSDGKQVVLAELTTATDGYTHTYTAKISVLCGEEFTPSVSASFSSNYYNLVAGTSVPEKVTNSDMTTSSNSGKVVFGTKTEMTTSGATAIFTLTEAFYKYLSPIASNAISRLDDVPIAESNKYLPNNSQRTSVYILYGNSLYISVVPELGYNYEKGANVVGAGCLLECIKNPLTASEYIAYPNAFYYKSDPIKNKCDDSVSIYTPSTITYNIEYKDADGVTDIQFANDYTPVSTFNITSGVVLPTSANIANTTNNKVFVGWTTNATIRTANSSSDPTAYNADTGTIGNTSGTSPLVTQNGFITEIASSSYLKEAGGTITFIANYVELNGPTDLHLTYGYTTTKSGDTTTLTIPQAITNYTTALSETESPTVYYQWYKTSNKLAYTEDLTNNNFYAFYTEGEIIDGTVIEGATNQSYSYSGLNTQDYYFCYAYINSQDENGNDLKMGYITYASPTTLDVQLTTTGVEVQSIEYQWYVTSRQDYGEFTLTSSDKCSTIEPTVVLSYVDESSQPATQTLAFSAVASNGTSASYSIPEGQTAGTYFYFVKITITFPGGQTTVLYSQISTVVINRNILTVTAEDQSVSYGSAVPDYTVTVEGIQYASETDSTIGDLNANAVSYFKQFATSSYQRWSNVGEYSIVFLGTKPSTIDNYNVFYQPGKLTVTPATDGNVLIEFTPNIWFDLASNNTIIPPLEASGDVNKAGFYYISGERTAQFVVKVKHSDQSASEYITLESYEYEIVIEGDYVSSTQTNIGSYNLKVRVTNGNFVGSVGTATWYIILPKVTLTNDSDATTHTIYPNTYDGKIYTSAFASAEYTTSIIPTARTGYTFNGWYLGENRRLNPDGSFVSDLSVINEETWKEVWTANTYFLVLESHAKDQDALTYETIGGGTVKIGSNDADTRVTKDVVYGTSVTITATPATGYTFGGWYANYLNGELSSLISSDATYTFDYSGEAFATNRTIYAKFVPESILFTANSNDGIFGTTTGWSNAEDKKTTTKSVYFGDTLGNLPFATREYYNLLGYSLSATSTRSHISGNTRELNILTLPSSATETTYSIMYSYTVNADAKTTFANAINNGDWGTIKITTASGESVTITGKFYVENINSTGGIIYTEANNFYGQYGNGFSAGDTIVFIGEFTQEAGAELTINGYNTIVSQDTNGTETYIADGAFDVALVAGSGMFVTNNTKITFTTNQTIYAIWNEEEYNITLDANGGTINGSTNLVIKRLYGETYGDLPTPTREYYTFKGWFTEKNAGTQVLASSSLSQNADHTLYAHWEIVTYTVTLVCDNATGGYFSVTDTGTAFGTYTKLTSKLTVTIPALAGIQLNGHVLTITYKDANGANTYVCTITGCVETGNAEFSYAIESLTVDPSLTVLTENITVTLSTAKTTQVYTVEIIAVNGDDIVPSSSYGTIKQGTSDATNQISLYPIYYNTTLNISLDNMYQLNIGSIANILAIENEPTATTEYVFMGYYTSKTSDGYAFDPKYEFDTTNNKTKTITIYARFISQPRRFNVSIDFGSDTDSMVQDTDGTLLYPGYLTNGTGADSLLSSATGFKKDDIEYINNYIYKIPYNNIIGNTAGNEWLINILTDGSLTAGTLLAQTHFFVETKEGEYKFATQFAGFDIKIKNAEGNWQDYITTEATETFNLTITSDVKILVKFTVVPVFVTINFIDNPEDYGQVSTSQIDVPYGSKIKFENDTVKIYNSITISGKNITINDSETPSETVTISLPAESDDYNYKFDKWETSSTGESPWTTRASGDIVTLIDNTTVRANYSRTAKTYNVTIQQSINWQGLSLSRLKELLSVNTVSGGYAYEIKYTYAKEENPVASELASYYELNADGITYTKTTDTTISSSKTYYIAGLTITVKDVPYDATIKVSSASTLEISESSTKKFSVTFANVSDRYCTYELQNYQKLDDAVVTTSGLTAGKNAIINANINATVRTYNVTATVLPSGYGVVNSASTVTIGVPYGTKISANGTTLSLSGAEWLGNVKANYSKVVEAKPTAEDTANGYTYTFVGYYYGETLIDSETNIITIAESAINLTAKFSRTVATYTYTYNVYGDALTSGTTAENNIIIVSSGSYSSSEFSHSYEVVYKDGKEYNPVTHINFTLPHGAVISYATTTQSGSDSQMKQVVVTISYNSNMLFTITTTSRDNTTNATYYHTYAGYDTTTITGGGSNSITFSAVTREYTLNIIAGIENEDGEFIQNTNLTNSDICGKLALRSANFTDGDVVNAYSGTIKYGAIFSILNEILDDIPFTDGTKDIYPIAKDKTEALTYKFVKYIFGTGITNNDGTLTISGLSDQSENDIYIYVVFEETTRIYNFNLQTVQSDFASLVWATIPSGETLPVTNNGLTTLNIKYGSIVSLGTEEIEAGKFEGVSAGTYRTITLYYPEYIESDPTQNVQYKAIVVPKANVDGKEYAFSQFTTGASTVVTGTVITLNKDGQLWYTSSGEGTFGLNIIISETIITYNLTIQVDNDSTGLGNIIPFTNGTEGSEKTSITVTVQHGVQFNVIGSRLTINETDENGKYIYQFAPNPKEGRKFVEFYYKDADDNKIVINEDNGTTIKSALTIYVKFTGSIEVETYRLTDDNKDQTALQDTLNIHNFNLSWIYDGVAHNIMSVGYILTTDTAINGSKTYYIKKQNFAEVVSPTTENIGYYYELSADGKTYTKTTDTEVNNTKTYYQVNSQTFEKVATPVLANIKTYYEVPSFDIYYSDAVQLTDDNYTSGTTSLTSYTNADTYTLYYYINSTSSAYDSVYGKIEIEIGKRPVAVIDVSATKFVYNKTEQHPTYKVVYAEDNSIIIPDTNYSSITKTSDLTSVVSPINVGDYIEVVSLNSDNYIFVGTDTSEYSIPFKITPAPLIVNWSISSDGLYEYQADTNKNPTIVSVSGVITGDSINYAIKLDIKTTGFLTQKTTITKPSGDYSGILVQKAEDSSFYYQNITIESGSYKATAVFTTLTDGYYLEHTGTLNYYFSNPTVEYKIVGHDVFILWPDSQKVNITFNADGGLVNDSATVTSEMIAGVSFGAFGELPVASKTGFKFVGWFTTKQSETSGTGTQVTASSIVNDTQTTLYAWYSTSIVKITLNGADADIMGTEYLYFETSNGSAERKLYYNILSNNGELSLFNEVNLTADKIVIPYKNGATFLGYKLNKDGTGDYIIDSAGTVSNIIFKITTSSTIYACWDTDPSYTITYNLDGGTLGGATNPTSYTADTATFTLNNPTKIGYVFIGWTGSNGTTPSTSVTIYTGSVGNLTFTANWQVESYDAPTNVQIYGSLYVRWNAVTPIADEEITYVVKIYSKNSSSQYILISTQETTSTIIDIESLVISEIIGAGYSVVQADVYAKENATHGYGASGNGSSSDYNVSAVYFWDNDGDWDNDGALPASTRAGVNGSTNMSTLMPGDPTLSFGQNFDGWYYHSSADTETQIDEADDVSVYSDADIYPVTSWDQVRISISCTIDSTTKTEIVYAGYADTWNWITLPDWATIFGVSESVYSFSYDETDGAFRSTDDSDFGVNDLAVTWSTTYMAWLYSTTCYANVNDITISFELTNSGDSFSPLVVTPPYTLQDTDYPVCDEAGYEYVWNKVASPITEDTTITGTKEAITYTIYFQVTMQSGEESLISTIEKEYGSSLDYSDYPRDDDLPVNTSGYEWGDWYVFATEDGSSIDYITGSLILNKNEEIIISPITVTYIFYKVDGTQLSSSSADGNDSDGITISFPTPPTAPSGSTFDGAVWESSDGNIYSDGDVVYVSLTFSLTAEVGQITIYFNDYNATVSFTSKTVTIGQAFGELPTWTRSGYTFICWSYSDSDESQAISSSTIASLSDDNVTFQPIYTANPSGTTYYTVTYELRNLNNYLVASDTEQVEAGTPYNELTYPLNPEDFPTEYYWNCDPNGGGAIYAYFISDDEYGNTDNVVTDNIVFVYYETEEDPFAGVALNNYSSSMWDNWLTLLGTVNNSPTAQTTAYTNASSSAVVNNIGMGAVGVLQTINQVVNDQPKTIPPQATVEPVSDSSGKKEEE